MLVLRDFIGVTVFWLFLFIVVTRDTIDLITLVNMSCQRLKVGYVLGPQKETTVFPFPSIFSCKQLQSLKLTN